MVHCNNTLENEGIHEVELPGIHIIFHHLGLVISLVFGLIACGVAFYLIAQHARHYTRPWEQKHIIRILLMIPIYAIVSFLSYAFFKDYLYYSVLRDCYEAFAIASFFTLLCNYIAPTLHDQKEFFRTLRPVNWVWPLNWFQRCTGGETEGAFRKPRSGLTWFNIIYLCIFQYCLIRILFTILAVATEAGGVYCENSLSPAFAHIWVEVIEGLSVSVAMYALIQFYVQLRSDLAEHRPFLKLLCIKLVIFFSFWQSLVISFLVSGPLHQTKYISYPDLSVGIPSMLICMEMLIFGVLHLFAFPWKATYAIPKDHELSVTDAMHASGLGYSGKPSYQGGPWGWKAFVDAFNPWDIIKATGRGFRWLFVGRRKRQQDISYKRYYDGQNGEDDGNWGGGGAFDGDDDENRQNSTNAVNGGGKATKLQTFGRDPKLRPVSDEHIPTFSVTGPSPAHERQRSYGEEGYQPHFEARSQHRREYSAEEADDPWTTDTLTDPYAYRGASADLARDESPGSHYERARARGASGTGEELGDTAGLLTHAGGVPTNSGGRYGYSDDRRTRPTSSTVATAGHPTSQAYGPRGVRGRDPDESDSDEEEESAMAPGGHETHPSNADFMKDVEVERQYRGYGRNSWGRGDDRSGGGGGGLR